MLQCNPQHSWIYSVFRGWRFRAITIITCFTILMVQYSLELQLGFKFVPSTKYLLKKTFSRPCGIVWHDMIVKISIMAEHKVHPGASTFKIPFEAWVNI